MRTHDREKVFRRSPARQQGLSDAAAASRVSAGGAPHRISCEKDRHPLVSSWRITRRRGRSDIAPCAHFLRINTLGGDHRGRRRPGRRTHPSKTRRRLEGARRNDSHDPPKSDEISDSRGAPRVSRVHHVQTLVERQDHRDVHVLPSTGQTEFYQKMARETEIMKCHTLQELRLARKISARNRELWRTLDRYFPVQIEVGGPSTPPFLRMETPKKSG